MNILELLGIFTIGSTCITTLLVFLGKKIIDYFFMKSLQKYKSNLELQFQSYKLELNKQIESYKTNLQKATFEHQIKYSKLHEERALVIKELFSKLVKVEKSMGSFVALFEPVGERPKEEKGKDAAKDFNDFLDYVRTNEIYFSDDICELMYKIIDEIRDAWLKFITYPSYKKIDYFLPEPKLAEIEKKKLDFWIEAWKKINQDIPTLKKQLKQELQKMLGVEGSNE